MNRLKIWVLTLAAATVLGTVLAAAVLGLMTPGSGGTPSVGAIVPTATPTPGPVPTPKPDNMGILGGVYDIQMYQPGNRAMEAYGCIAKLDHAGPGDILPNRIKIATMCYSDLDKAMPNGEPRNDPPGEGPDGAKGPPPPPPYTMYAPVKGNGQYTGLGPDMLTFTFCQANIGGINGPNKVFVVTIQQANIQLTGGPPKNEPGTMTGVVQVYGKQGQTQCESKIPKGPFDTFDIKLERVSTKPGGPPGPTVSPNKSTRFPRSFTDYDGDGCPDAAELNKPLPGPGKCGDDPYNPWDSTITDFSGPYYIQATVFDADACWNGTYKNQAPGHPLYIFDCIGKADGTLVGGFYYICLADVQQNGKILTIRPSCYTDHAGGTALLTPTGSVVNPEAALDNNGMATNPKNCGPAPTQAPAKYCGDGLFGSAPPGISVKGAPGGVVSLFGDTNATKVTVLSGVVDNPSNTWNINGCFYDEDGLGALGNVSIKAKLDAHTGEGTVLIATAQSDANCFGADAIYGNADDGLTQTGVIARDPLRVARQAPGPKGSGPRDRDSDTDGCTDKEELQNDRTMGGLRDPQNHYDFFDAVHVGPPYQILVPDILAVVQQYFIDDLPGPIDYKSNTDRTAITGSNVWNLGPPDGLQRVPDILAVVKQYFDKCT